MKKKKMLLIGGLAFIGLFPRMVHAAIPAVPLNPCPDGKMVMSVGETVDLIPDYSLDSSNSFNPTEWKISGTGIIKSKDDLVSYNGKNLLELQALTKGKDTVTFVFQYTNSGMATGPAKANSTCEVSVVDTKLKTLTLSSGTINFDENIKEYNLEVENIVDSIEIQATLSDITNSEFVQDYGPRKVELSAGKNTLVVSIKDKATGYQTNYTLNITKKEAKITLKKLVDELKKSETAQLYYDNSEQMKLDIEEVSDGIKISVTNLESNQTVSSNFKYEKGVLSLVPVTDGDLSTSLFDFLWSGEILNTVASIQGLPANKINGWLKSLNVVNESDCTLETTGFEIDMADDSENSSSLLTAFKIDLANGLKIDPDKIDEYEIDKEEDKEETPVVPEDSNKEEEKNEGTTDNENTNTTPENKDEVANPSTGDLNIFAVTIFILTVFSLAGLSIYKIRKN